MMRVPSRIHRWLLASVALVAGAIVAAPAAASAAPAEPTFTRFIEPWDPAEEPLTPPAVDLTAACVRKAQGGFEAVFGYANPDQTSILVELDPDTPRDENANIIVRTEALTSPPIVVVDVEDLGPQVTLFKPGPHPYAFAAHFTRRQNIAWEVKIPEESGPRSWRVTVSPRMGAPCPADVPKHFTVVQQVTLSTPTAVNLTFDGDHITNYDVEYKMRTMRAACSSGGELLEPTVVVGWPTVSGLEPIVPDYRIAIDRSGTRVVYQMSTITVRHKTDLFARIDWLGPIADVTARCEFGNKVVKSDAFWAELTGFGFLEPIVENGFVVGFSGSQNAPVGSRLR
jgi:hypothetical protein